jgi:hypothetical protein
MKILSDTQRDEATACIDYVNLTNSHLNANHTHILLKINGSANYHSKRFSDINFHIQ